MTAKPLFEILDYTETPLGTLCLRRREMLSRPGTVITEVTLAGEFLMSSYHTASEEALADEALAMHPGQDLRVLVGGLGLGYTAHRALASTRVASVEVVEYLPPVVGWFEDEIVPLASELNADSRFSTRAADVYKLLRRPCSETYDLILIDVDHNPDETLHAENAFFYTEDGVRKAREHLTPGGVLAVWSSAENSAFADALHAVFDETKVVPVHWHNELIDEKQRDDLFLARRAHQPS